MTTLLRAATLMLAGTATFALAVHPGRAAELPPSMRAMAIDKAGEPLTLHMLPVPKPAPDEVLVEAHERQAAGHVLGKILLRVR